MKLTISGYKSSSFEKSSLIGTYETQLNPSELSVTVGQEKIDVKKDDDALGNTMTSKAPIFLKKSLSFDFILDTTGAIPKPPFGVSSRSVDLNKSISLLELYTVKPVGDIHRPPFVWLKWGNFSMQGVVQTFSYKYTYFNASGEPIRAKVSMSINDFDEDGALFKSPDITKMPTVKEGDSIVKLSEEYYDNKKYYIKLANFNKMSSLRGLKKGSQFQIPPINK